MKKFITSMLSEGGKISHKRAISVIVTLVVCFMSSWITIKHPAYITDALHWLLVFIAIMSGVATVPQIIALFRGGTLPQEEKKEEEAK